MYRLASAIVVVAALAVWTAPAARMQTSPDKLEISAFAVNMSNIATGTNAVVEIAVDSWSTPEERQHLVTTALEKDAETLLRELQKAAVHGRFRVPGIMGPDPHQLRLGHDIHYAWQEALPEGGRRIVLATDRYIGFREAINQPRTADYPFTLFEIHVDAKGEGEGKVAVATKIEYDKGEHTMVIENYSSEPVRLQQVRVKPRT